MPYDPFARGPHGVVMRGGTLVDHARAGRRLEFDLRAPDGADATRLILFSHTSFGHRRQASSLLDHLASHGFAVVAADHAGNAAADLDAHMAGAPARTDSERAAYVERIVGDRVPDLRILADAVLADHPRIDAGGIGVIGWSFGGWAALATPESDDRFTAVAAIAPAGSSNPLPGIIPATLTFGYRREVQVIYLAGDADVATPLDGIIDIRARTPGPSRLFVLRGAGHDHFGDAAQETPPSLDHAQAFTRGLVLAHVDASLGGVQEAEDFLEHRAVEALAARGVSAFNAA